MNAEGRQQRRRKTGMPAVVLRIVLPPLILALARACPGPPMRHLHAVEARKGAERCGFLFVFPEDHANVQPSVMLYGLLDGSCIDQREFLCQMNITAKQDSVHRSAENN
ncbi:Protein of unknown function, partial [Gryllus bimaculatus]